MEITKEVRQRIFALYIGSEIQAPDPYETKDLEKGFLTGIHGEYGAEIQFVVDGNAEETPAYESFDKCQLILKPLSEITDEDAYYIGRAVNCWSKSDRNMEFHKSDEMRPVHIGAGQAFAEAIGKDWGHGMSHPFANNSTDILHAFDYLRSKSYALPYLGIDLFESGIAVKPTNS